MKITILWLCLLASSVCRAEPSLALKGLDPIFLVEGKEVPGRLALRKDYGRFSYVFASRAHQKQFLANPERYGIQAGGRCLHMSQMEGDPSFFKVVNGKIFLAADAGCLAALTGNLDAYVEKLGRPRKKVAILLFPQVQIIDYTGPWEVFGEAGYDVFSVAATAEPLVTVMGMRVVPNYTFAASPTPDILVLPGGGVPSPTGPADPTIQWIRQKTKQAEITMSVCNGAFWLANAGLLDGLRATTTANQNLAALAQGFPRITVVDDERFVDNGRIITTAGLSSGIDGALHVVERLEGRGVARAVALGLEYDWRPDDGYARGAMADKYLRRLGEFELPKDVRMKNGDQSGDRQHWERAWDVGGPGLTGTGVVQLMDRALAKVWTKTGEDKEPEQGSRWAFKGDDGKPWAALVRVKPVPGAADSFVLTLSIRQN
jgi:putative intracellular protease/amidase